MSNWFGPTGQGKLLESTSHEEKAVFFFEDARDLSLCSTPYQWGMRETPTDGSFTLSDFLHEQQKKV
ncbi:hypothetical protein [Bacillus chungangensis]|uniref:Uncharacterized protein n=1 Tax=Bacillus chungangensis TaxID=587633 RepID=A0ABT9WYT0_9BACI|nr:hypothetical protein [Bacillus chungangensis]MDQ0178279.1 hypothetical protein [Bacillus chungangensis]